MEKSTLDISPTFAKQLKQLLPGIKSLVHQQC